MSNVEKKVVLITLCTNLSYGLEEAVEHGCWLEVEERKAFWRAARIAVAAESSDSDRRGAGTRAEDLLVLGWDRMRYASLE